MTISKSHAGLAICGFLMFAVVISGDAWLARGKLCWFVELHGRLVCVLDVHLLTCSETYLLQYFFWQSVARCRSFVVVSRWCVMVTYASSVSWCFDVICNPPGRSMIQRHPIHIYIYVHCTAGRCLCWPPHLFKTTSLRSASLEFRKVHVLAIPQCLNQCPNIATMYPEDLLMVHLFRIGVRSCFHLVPEQPRQSSRHQKTKGLVLGLP